MTSTVPQCCMCLIVLCREAANCRQQGNANCKYNVDVDAAMRCSWTRILKLAFTVVKQQIISLRCCPTLTMLHVAQDNSHLRDLINLEGATLSKTICPLSHWSFNARFVSAVHSHGIHWCTVKRNLSSIWYGRQGFCSAARSSKSTSPNDAIYPVPIRKWSIPAPWVALPLGFPWTSSW